MTVPLLSRLELEAVVLAGQQAEELLASVAFQASVNDLSDLHLKALVACRPIVGADKEARDYHHTMLHALQELHITIQTRVSYGQEAAMMLGGEVDEEDDLS